LKSSSHLESVSGKGPWSERKLVCQVEERGEGMQSIWIIHPGNGIEFAGRCKEALSFLYLWVGIPEVPEEFNHPPPKRWGFACAKHGNWLSRLGYQIFPLDGSPGPEAHVRFPHPGWGKAPDNPRH